MICIKSLRVWGGVLWSVPLMNHYLLHSLQISHFILGELKAAAEWGKKKKKKRSTLPGQRTAEILTSQKRLVSPNDKLEMRLLGLHSVALWSSSSQRIPQAWTFIMESSKFSSTNQSPWEELTGPTLSFTNILWQVFLGHRLRKEGSVARNQRENMQIKSNDSCILECDAESALLPRQWE